MTQDDGWDAVSNTPRKGGLTHSEQALTDELNAMLTIATALESLNADQARRALQWIAARYLKGDK